MVGHQPLTTKKGKDEMDVEDFHFVAMKKVFEKYASIIKVGLFGHRNLAGRLHVHTPNTSHVIFLFLYDGM